MGKWTKTVKKELDVIFPKNVNQFMEDDDFITSFSYQSVRIAGQEVLRASMSIHHKRIEKEWTQYKKELLLQENLMFPTVFVNSCNQNIANSITKDSIVLDGLNKNDIIELVREVYVKNYIEKINFYKSIVECNSIINRDISISDEVGKVTSLEGLVFRKVLLAKETEDNRFQEILDEMRLYCDNSSVIGKKENFEQLCRLKPVFKKMFTDFL